MKKIIVSANEPAIQSQKNGFSKLPKGKKPPSQTDLQGGEKMSPRFLTAIKG